VKKVVLNHKNIKIFRIANTPRHPRDIYAFGATLFKTKHAQLSNSALMNQLGRKERLSWLLSITFDDFHMFLGHDVCLNFKNFCKGFSFSYFFHYTTKGFLKFISCS
jgi:hypothetical protein